jgi:transposase
MTANEQIAALEAMNASLQQLIATQQAEIAMLREQVKRLEGQRAKDSHNSSKPPATDGIKRKTKSLRERSGKKPGGQLGHEGKTLTLVETPDVVVVSRPATCANCHASLEGVAAEGRERRQIQELPPIRLQVTEYQAEHVICPQCHQRTGGAFPEEVNAPTQYGPQLKGFLLYLLYGQFLPYHRVAEMTQEVLGVTIAVGTLEGIVQQGASRLADAETQIKTALQTSTVLGNDETGMYVGTKREWLHVSRTDQLTHYARHAKRGKLATDAIGILPVFHGTSLHDGYASYPQYEQCTHALCNAHHLRELTFFAEVEQQTWAATLKTHLLDCHRQVELAREHGATALAPDIHRTLVDRYHTLVQQGLAALPSSDVPQPGRGRKKQSPAKNLLDRFQRGADAVLRFLGDFSVPFTNNGSERDLRMPKVHQKISGTFRSEDGADAFCRIRGYLSTMAKQGYHLLDVLRDVFAGVVPSPLPSLAV